MPKKNTRKSKASEAPKQDTAPKKKRLINLATASKEEVAEAVRAAFEKEEDLYDTCAGHGIELPLSVFERKGRIVHAKKKGDGSRHARKCRKHSVDMPTNIDCGWLGGVCKQLKNGITVLRFLLSPEADGEGEIPRDLPDDIDEDEEPPKKRTRLPGATPMGLLCTLFQVAGLNHHNPGKRRSEYEVFWQLRGAAMKVALAGFPETEWNLANSLLLPSGYEKTWTSNNVMSVASAGGFPVFAVTKIDKQRFASGLANGYLHLDPIFGVPVRASSRVLHRALLRFRAGGKSMIEARKTMLFGAGSVNTNRDGQLEVRLDEVCLLALTDNWIPNFSSREHAAFSEFEELEIQYSVELVFDSGRWWGMRPDATIMSLIPGEIFGMKLAKYLARKRKKLEKYDRECPGRYWVWDALNESLVVATDRLLELIAKLKRSP